MNYNNNDDKFELSQYINEIEKILIKETVEEIINYLARYKMIIKSFELKNNLNHNFFYFMVKMMV